MKLNPPKKLTFWISVAIAVVGILVYLLRITSILTYAWLAPIAVLLLVIAFGILCAGLLIKGF